MNFALYPAFKTVLKHIPFITQAVKYWLYRLIYSILCIIDWLIDIKGAGLRTTILATSPSTPATVREEGRVGPWVDQGPLVVRGGFQGVQVGCREVQESSLEVREEREGSPAAQCLYLDLVST